MIKAIVFATLSITSATAWGVGAANNYLISSVRVDATGKGFVTFQTPLTDTPANCNAAYGSVLAFDTNTDAGRAVFSLLSAAKVSGAKVTARGTGSCVIYPALIEDWASGSIE